MKKLRTHVQITKSVETNNIFPLKWCNHKYFHKFKNFISQSGSEGTPLLGVVLDCLNISLICVYNPTYLKP